MFTIKTNIHPPAAEVGLHQAKVWKQDGDLRGETIACLQGRLWVTQEGDLNDYVIYPGESFWVTRPGTVVVQALEDGLFKFSRYAQPEAHPA
jgi:hypothetical protein